MHFDGETTFTLREWDGQMRTTEGYKLAFESWGEMVDRSVRGASALEDWRRKSRCTEKRTARFTGTESFERAAQLAEDGWRKLEGEIQIMAQPIFDRLASLVEREDLRFNKEGAGIDVAKFAENDPDCWMEFVPTYVDGKSTRILKIIFNASVHCGTPTDAIKRKGAMTTALIQLLEYSGYRVDLTVADATQGSGGRLEIYTPLKKPDQPLDMGRTLFALAHPSYLRRIMFSVMETVPEKWLSKFNVPDWGYGMATQATEHGDIIIPENVYGYNDEKIEEWIMDTTEKAGISFHPTSAV